MAQKGSVFGASIARFPCRWGGRAQPTRVVFLPSLRTWFLFSWAYPGLTSWAIFCRPSGAGFFFFCLPGAHAPGCILPPLRGWSWVVRSAPSPHQSGRSALGAEARF